MKSFSAVDAALAGFRLMRERPRVILAWAVFFFAANAISSVVVVLTGAGDALAALQALDAADPNSLEPMLQALAGLGPMALASAALSLVFYSVIFTAAFRAYLRPADRAPGALRFGGDEVRTGALLLLTFFLWLAYLFIVLFLGGLAVAFGLMLGQPLSALLDLVAILGMAAALAYPWVRLSLALPMTLDRGRVSLFEAWALTRGHFWPLLGAYVLAAAMIIVVALLCVMVMAGILGGVALSMGGGIDDLTRLTQPSLTSLAGAFTVPVMLWVALNSLMSAALLAIWAGPPAEIYRALAASQPAP